MPNIFNILDKITDGDFDYIDSLTEQELKSFEPYVTQLWLRGAVQNNAVHVYLTNQVVNKYTFFFSKHPKLLYKLMCAANGGFDHTKYRFIKRPKKKQSKSIKLLCDYYNYSPRRAVEALSLLDDNQLIEIAYSMGYDDKEVKAVLAERK